MNPDSLNYYILHFLVSSFVCAVDVFMLISGYFSVNSLKVDLWKPIKLFIQVIVFSVGVFILRCLFGTADFTFDKLIIYLLPINYFVILYVAVYITSPYINLLIQSLDIKQNRKLVLVLMLLFSVYPTIVDILSIVLKNKLMGLSTIGIFGSQWGYTIVNFLLMYIIGAVLRRDDVVIKYLTNKCKFYLCIVIMIITYLSILFTSQDVYWYYHNPLVILAAVFIFVFFYNLKIVKSKVVNSMAQSVFTVFLMYSWFFKYLKIQEYAISNSLVMLVHLLGSAVFIFILCYPVGLLYNFLEAKVIAQ